MCAFNPFGRVVGVDQICIGEGMRLYENAIHMQLLSLFFDNLANTKYMYILPEMSAN